MDVTRRSESATHQQSEPPVAKAPIAQYFIVSPLGLDDDFSDLAPPPDSPKHAVALFEVLSTKHSYVNPRITIAELANLVAIHLDEPCGCRTVSRAILRTFKVSLPTYINKWRVREAARLLTLDPLRDLASVADESGFSSIYVLIRVFQRHLNITPRRYALERRQFLDSPP
jgi:transcriptional regulator GlxA family with amidase domain